MITELSNLITKLLNLIFFEEKKGKNKLSNLIILYRFCKAKIQRLNLNEKLLDGDAAGDEATKKILEALNGERVRDVRDDFGIHSQGYKDINEHLTKELAKQKKQQQKQEEPPRKGYGFRR